MTTAFSNAAQKYPNKTFLVTIFLVAKLRHFNSDMKFGNEANSETVASSMTIVFSNTAPKICRPEIFNLKLKSFYFRTKNKIEDADFIYDNGFFKLFPKKYANKAIFILFVVLHETLCI